jgi:acyl transferase domain-containing protein
MSNMVRIAMSRSEPIAIIGTSCGFPGGSYSPSKLWELLKHPVDLSKGIPPSRFNTTGFHHEDLEYPGVRSYTSFCRRPRYHELIMITP